MFLKVNQGSLLYDKLFSAFVNDELCKKNFNKWQVENLPEFNNEVLIERSPWYIFAEVVGWKFTGEVDKNVWQPITGWEGYYEPNKCTKAGKAMRESIYEARGKRFNRTDFFDMFGLSMPVCGNFSVPNGFFYDGVCYLVFEDFTYNDLSTKLAGQFEEITREEWDAAMNARNEENKK